MTDYDHTTIALKQDTHEQLSEAKPDGVTWNHFIKERHRLASAYERDSEGGNDE